MRIIRKRFMDEEETDHSYNWQDVLWRSDQSMEQAE